MIRYWMLLVALLLPATLPAQRASYPKECTLTYIKASTTPDSTKARCLADRARVDLYNATTAYARTDSLNRIALTKYQDAAVKDTVARALYDSVMQKYKPKPPSNLAATVAIHSAGASVAVGATLQLYSEVKDAAGNVLPKPVAWSVNDTSKANLSGTGLLTGKKAGTVTVSATADTATGRRDYAVTGGSGVPPDTAKPPVDTSGTTPPPIVTGPTPTPNPVNLGLGIATVAEVPRATVDLTYPTPNRQIRVAAGTNLQATINAAVSGDEIRLAPGASWAGNFILPKHACTAPIVIRTDGPITAPGAIMSPDSARKYNLAKVLALNNQGALGTADQASAGCWRITGLEIAEASGAADANGLVRFGDENSTTLAAQAHDLILDRSYVHGEPNVPVRRCLILNSIRSAVTDSWLTNCHSNTGDAQCILGYNGPGPFLIDNIWCEGGAEVVMWGGADPRIPQLIPSDIWIRNSVLTRSVADANGVYLVKNLLEVKAVQRMLVENVRMFSNWAHGQVGFAGLLKSVNQDGSCSWCRATDVTWRKVRLTLSGNGINLAGILQAPAQPSARFTFTDVTIDSLNFGPYAAQGMLSQVLANGSLSDVIFNHVSFKNGGPGAYWGLMQFDGGAVNKFVIANSALYCGGYGIKGSGTGSGMSALNVYVTNLGWANNALVGCNSGYPTGTTYFNSFSAITGVGTDGAPLGSRY